MKGLSTMKLFLLCPLLLATIEYASSSSPSVIIIGAGISGISAAKRLEEAGIKNFIILEATNRIGGRIKKTEFAGYTVEMGANWLQGVEGPMRNPLYEMSKQIHLKKFFSDFSNFSFNTYKQEGGLYKEDEVNAAIDKVYKTLEEGEKFSKILNSEKDDNDINDISILAFERLYKTDPRTKLERTIEFFNINAEQADAPRVTSLKHVLPFSEAHDFGENSYFVADPRGFESLVHLIAKHFLSYKNGVINDSRVKFNQVVKGITQSRDGVMVRTEDGKRYQANIVIVSASLGVLQSDLISFKPQLPHLENEYPRSNIMLVTVINAESVRVEEQSDEETKAEVMEVLRKMFGKGIPEATHILIPRWKSDRFCQGSYSNWPFGYSKKRHDQLRAPVGQVYFTGEHTHDRFFGYASGAYFAGINTAREVINCLKTKRFCRGL